LVPVHFFEQDRDAPREGIDALYVEAGSSTINALQFVTELDLVSRLDDKELRAVRQLATCAAAAGPDCSRNGH
jgi:hypothetical protein